MTPRWWRRVLSEGAVGADVELVQRKLGLPCTGFYGPDEAAAVRGVQRRMGVDPSGVVDDEVAFALGEGAASELVPEWWTRELHLNCSGADVVRLRFLLGLPQGDRFTHEVHQAILRLQSSLGLDLTGTVEDQLAIQLGE